MSETPAKYRVVRTDSERVELIIGRVHAALDDLDLPAGLHVVVTLTDDGPRVQAWADGVSARAVVTTDRAPAS